MQDEVNDFLSFCFLGENESNPLSAQVINSFFEELKIPAVYMPFQVQESRFIDALSVLRSNFNGFCVSESHKTAIAGYMDKLDKSARDSGIVSTVKNDNGKLTGYDTDSTGFRLSLNGFIEDAKQKRVLLLGAEGSAYAAADMLLKMGAALIILADNAVQLHLLKSNLKLSHNEKRITTMTEISETYDIFAVVNAAGPVESNRYSEAIPKEIFEKTKYFYDMSLGPSSLLKKADGYGADTKDGFDMIFLASIEAVKIWTGKDIPDAAISNVYNNRRTRYINVL